MQTQKQHLLTKISDLKELKKDLLKSGQNVDPILKEIEIRRRQLMREYYIETL